jgi:DNA polymerase-3 subunit epsilon/CBS domain-containing protein
VSAARTLAICHHVVERSTSARLAGIKALGIGGAHDLDAIARAQDIFLSRLLVQQIDDIDRGMPALNGVAVKRLTSDERDALRGAFKSIEHIDDLKRDLLFRS